MYVYVATHTYIYTYMYRHTYTHVCVHVYDDKDHPHIEGLQVSRDLLDILGAPYVCNVFKKEPM